MSTKPTPKPDKQEDKKSAQVDTWAVPNVQSDIEEPQGQTNALGKSRNWRYEPPEETNVAEPEPLTAQDIEDIRQAAFDEGFSQGKADGFAKGFEEGKISGHEEGLSTGHKEGVSQGLAEGKETNDQQVAAMQALIEQLHQPLLNVEKNVEAQLLQLVVQLTQAVTKHEAKTNPDILLSAIAEGIKALPGQESQTQILLHPQDIKLVEQQFGASHIKEQGWRLLAAPQLSPGSCQIENSTSNIDLSVKSRLNEVLESFLQEALHQ
ncbi:flagellar assembly protein FliH [Colwellia polaris]|jgi:flagellar assembly protein FliH|uniref:flagellar assembly protein FliH n=1 Tax=Colwellia polaris TaxID=326537 RepID=UPI000A170EC0|nr:flagellar assembly protein FliH [Colwellia polaris]|tara:strand:+ start:1052 stop:1846 length:795 start_codon:yes stop_codon:yes gene_type:complete